MLSCLVGATHAFAIAVVPRRTVTPLLGAGLGFGVQTAAVSGALGMLLTCWPQVHAALKCLAVGFLLYRGWQFMRAWRFESDTGSEPKSFWDAAVLQILNPGSWAIALSAATLVLPAQLLTLLANGHAETI
jgi:threonine/homoserine/homoserine lactone efflux protein